MNEGRGERCSYYPRIEGQQKAMKVMRTRAQVMSWETGRKRETYVIKKKKNLGCNRKRIWIYGSVKVVIRNLI